MQSILSDAADPWQRCWYSFRACAQVRLTEPTLLVFSISLPQLCRGCPLYLAYTALWVADAQLPVHGLFLNGSLQGGCWHGIWMLDQYSIQEVHKVNQSNSRLCPTGTAQLCYPVASPVMATARSLSASKGDRLGKAGVDKWCVYTR